MSNVISMPSYKEGLSDLQKQLSVALPETTMATFAKDAEMLNEKHRSILKLKEGDLAPDFTLVNALEQSVSLKGLLKDFRVVLVFYRGTWCPYCNLQLIQYQSVLGEFKKLGAQLVAISPQTPDESLNMQQKNDLKFPVLSDNGNMVARLYTTVFENDDNPIRVMTELGIDFTNHYSDDSNEIPVPAVFVIEKDGSISFAKAEGGDYRNRVESSEILKALQIEK